MFANPTKENLLVHADKFGWEGVAETAAEWGIPLERPADSYPRRKPSGPTLRERVRVMLADGHDEHVIAEMENLSPARARRLIGSVS